MTIVSANIYWDSFHENVTSQIFIPLDLTPYIFQKVKAINFLFSALHTTPFPNGQIHLGALLTLCQYCYV